MKADVLARTYRRLFATTDGKKVLADLLTATHVLAPIPPGDSAAMSFALGERNIGLRIAAMLAYKPTDFVRVAQETTEELTHG
jgi:hypothetical protein